MRCVLRKPPWLPPSTATLRVEGEVIARRHAAHAPRAVEQAQPQGGFRGTDDVRHVLRTAFARQGLQERLAESCSRVTRYATAGEMRAAHRASHGS